MNAVKAMIEYECGACHQLMMSVEGRHLHDINLSKDTAIIMGLRVIVEWLVTLLMNVEV